MGFGADGRNVQTVSSLHIRCIVEAADEGIGRNVDRALDIAITTQGEI